MAPTCAEFEVTAQPVTGPDEGDQVLGLPSPRWALATRTATAGSSCAEREHR